MVIERSVVIEESTVIPDATPDDVWRVFSRIESWPRLSPACLEAVPVQGGPLKQGATFRLILKSGLLKSKMTPTVVRANPPATVTWLGRSWGIYRQQTFTFEAVDSGTRAVAHEVYSGPMLWMLWAIAPQGRVRSMFRAWLEALTAELKRVQSV